MSANKCFFTGPNQLKSSQDHTNELKAETLYTNTVLDISNNINDVSHNIQVFTDQNRCLASVGGYNVNNYDLLLNLTKGRYYATKKHLVNVLPVECSNNHVSSCVSVDICNSTTIPGFDQTYNMYEGPLMTTNISSTDVSTCLPLTLNKELKIDPSHGTLCNFPFAKLVTEEKLRNFDFPFKFRIN